MQKAPLLEGESQKKMKLAERRPLSLIRARTSKEPIKIRWVDILKSNGESVIGKKCGQVHEGMPKHRNHMHLI